MHDNTSDRGRDAQIQVSRVNQHEWEGRSRARLRDVRKFQWSEVGRASYKCTGVFTVSPNPHAQQRFRRLLICTPLFPMQATCGQRA